MNKTYQPFVATLALVAVLTGGCNATGGAAGPPASPSSPAGSPSTAGTGTARPAALATTPPSWTTGPTTVVHSPAVPPVPVVTRVRYAAHPKEGYDRIVFDISGGLPGYSIRYVAQVRGDGTGEPISVPGRHHLLIVMNPAQAHLDSGKATISGIHRVDLPQIRAYAVAGDYEGYVSVAVGLDDKAGYRVGELPGRIYVDVAA